MNRHLDLFTGVGGFSLAARWTGWETIGFSEIDPYCCKVLAKNFPGIPNYGDITKLDGRTITADLITGGFPCQPFSFAGKQQGQNDERYLWPEMLRVIAECQPTWCLCENVVGLIGLALERVCVDLESLGFEVQPLVIPACAVNAPHRRDRVWILAHSESNRMEKPQGQNREPNNRSLGQGRVDPFRNGASAADAERNGLERSEYKIRGQGETDLRRRSADENWRLTQREFCGVDDGLPEGLDEDRRWGSNWDGDLPAPLGGDSRNRVHRLKALGNAIVPAVAAVIMKAIMEQRVRRGRND